MRNIVNVDLEPSERKKFISFLSLAECMCEFPVYSERRNCKGSFGRDTQGTVNTSLNSEYSWLMKCNLITTHRIVPVQKGHKTWTKLPILTKGATLPDKISIREKDYVILHIWSWILKIIHGCPLSPWVIFPKIPNRFQTLCELSSHIYWW